MIGIRKFSHETRAAFVLTGIVLTAVAGAGIALYLLVSIRLVQHSNGDILNQIQVIVNNHTASFKLLTNICRSIPHCVVKVSS